MQERNPTTKEMEEVKKGLTWRSISIGALVIICGAYVWLDILYACIWGLGFRLYWVYYDGYAPNNHALVPVLLIVFLINPILRRLNRRSIDEKELLVVNNMAQFGLLFISLFATLIPAGMMGLNLPAMQNPVMYGDIAQRFSGLFFVESGEIERWFQEGSTYVDWSKWIIPFIGWVGFALVMVALFFSLGTIIRRRWTDEERLRYPIGQLKLAYIQGKDPDTSESLWKNKLFWLGALIAFLFAAPNYLTTIWPWIPDTSTAAIRNARNSILSGNINIQTAFGITTNIHPVVMSALWFVEVDLLFSIWFFYIFKSIVNLILVSNMSMGLIPGNMRSASVTALHTTIGAQAALALVYLWVGRGSIKAIVKKAFKTSDLDDSKEPMSYRNALICTIVCVILFSLFSILVLQMSLTLSLITLIIIILMGIGLARMRVEAGIGAQFGTGDWPILDSFIPLVGSKTIGYENAGFGAFNNIFGFPFFCYLGGFLEAWKMGDALEEDRRTVMKSIWVGLFITAMVLALIFIPNMYKHGFNKTMARNNAYSLRWGNVANALKLGTRQRDPSVLFWYIYSFLMVIVMGWLRTKFAWWPLHPVGFVTGGTVWAGYFVDMAFIVWIVKAMVMRYGGYQSFKSVTPIFIGLGVGQILASLLGLFLSTLQLIRVI